MANKRDLLKGKKKLCDGRENVTHEKPHLLRFLFCMWLSPGLCTLFGPLDSLGTHELWLLHQILFSELEMLRRSISIQKL